MLNNKGFSLVELMIVVAIIGLLAAIGIPQYAKFQAKARTSEARAALSMLYTAEQSFFGEWRLYTVDLRNIGFGVTGTSLRYITGFQSGTACTNYVTTGGAPTESTAITNTWSDGTNVNTGSQAATFATFTAGAGTRTLQATTCVATLGRKLLLEPQLVIQETTLQLVQLLMLGQSIKINYLINLLLVIDTSPNLLSYV